MNVTPMSLLHLSACTLSWSPLQSNLAIAVAVMNPLRVFKVPVLHVSRNALGIKSVSSCVSAGASGSFIMVAYGRKSPNHVRAARQERGSPFRLRRSDLGAWEDDHSGGPHLVRFRRWEGPQTRRVRKRRR